MIFALLSLYPVVGCICYPNTQPVVVKEATTPMIQEVEAIAFIIFLAYISQIWDSSPWKYLEFQHQWHDPTELAQWRFQGNDDEGLVKILMQLLQLRNWTLQKLDGHTHTSEPSAISFGSLVNADKNIPHELISCFFRRHCLLGLATGY